MARTARKDGQSVSTPLGSRIRRARRDAQLSQSQLAERIGAHVTSVSDWERGRNAPSARHLLSIAKATGTDVAHFSEEGEDDEEADPVIDLVKAIRLLVRTEMRGRSRR